MTINDVGRIGPHDNELEAIKKRNADLQFCLDKEVARVMALTQHNAEMLTASKNFYSSVCGGKKLCGHDFECVCPSDLLREAIAKAGGAGGRESLQQVYNRIDASDNPLSDALQALAKAGGA